MNNSEYGESGQGCSNPDRKYGRFVVPGATISYKERSFWRRKGTCIGREISGCQYQQEGIGVSHRHPSQDKSSDPPFQLF